MSERSLSSDGLDVNTGSPQKSLYERSLSPDFTFPSHDETSHNADSPSVINRSSSSRTSSISPNSSLPSSPSSTQSLQQSPGTPRSFSPPPVRPYSADAICVDDSVLHSSSDNFLEIIETVVPKSEGLFDSLRESSYITKNSSSDKYSDERNKMIKTLRDFKSSFPPEHSVKNTYKLQYSNDPSQSRMESDSSICSPMDTTTSNTFFGEETSPSIANSSTLSSKYGSLYSKIDSYLQKDSQSELVNCNESSYVMNCLGKSKSVSNEFSGSSTSRHDEFKKQLLSWFSRYSSKSGPDISMNLSNRERLTASSDLPSQSQLSTNSSGIENLCKSKISAKKGVCKGKRSGNERAPTIGFTESVAAREELSGLPLLGSRYPNDDRSLLDRLIDDITNTSKLKGKSKIDCLKSSALEIPCDNGDRIDSICRKLKHCDDFLLPWGLIDSMKPPIQGSSMSLDEPGSSQTKYELPRSLHNTERCMSSRYYLPPSYEDSISTLKSLSLPDTASALVCSSSSPDSEFKEQSNSLIKATSLLTDDATYSRYSNTHLPNSSLLNSGLSPSKDYQDRKQIVKQEPLPLNESDQRSTSLDDMVERNQSPSTSLPENGSVTHGAVEKTLESDVVDVELTPPCVVDLTCEDDDDVEIVSTDQPVVFLGTESAKEKKIRKHKSLGSSSSQPIVICDSVPGNSPSVPINISDIPDSTTDTPEKVHNPILFGDLLNESVIAIDLVHESSMETAARPRHHISTALNEETRDECTGSRDHSRSPLAENFLDAPVPPDVVNSIKSLYAGIQYPQPQSVSLIKQDLLSHALDFMHMAYDGSQMSKRRKVRDASHPSSLPRPSTSSAATVSQEGDNLSCPICFEYFQDIKKSGRSLSSTVCGHIFCTNCLEASLRQTKCCPTCRKRLNKKQYHPLYI